MERKEMLRKIADEGSCLNILCNDCPIYASCQSYYSVHDPDGKVLNHDPEVRAMAQRLLERPEPIPVDDSFGPPDEDQHAPGAKLDAGKNMMDLIPAETLQHLGEVLTFGCRKYSRDGWKAVSDAKNRYSAAMLRHYAAWKSGESLDPESGIPHITHMMCNAVFLDYLERSNATRTENDSA